MSVADAGKLSLADTKGGLPLPEQYWATKEEVRELIRATGLTHREIAERLGMSVDGVHGWTRTTDRQGQKSKYSPISGPCYLLLKLLADQDPDYRLVKRRKPL